MALMRCAARLTAAVCFVGVTATPARAQEPPPATASAATESAATTRSSPWLIVPVVSSNPKLGTAFGALGAFLHRFDRDSRVSIFGVTYQYTSTDSQIAGLVARTSFGADHHRVTGVVGFGAIKNDYDDYLGTGQPLKTEDKLKAAFGRYLYRLKGNWFIGAQGAGTNYQLFGATPEDDFVLESLGLTGFEAAGAGVVALHDSRDSEDMPARGWYFNVNNLAYREALGGAASFDTYRADARVFLAHGARHVLAVRQNNWLTADAPAAGQATVMLRGYKIGQYLAPFMSSLEVEERISLHRRWGATVFAGVAGLYGARTVASASRDFYPVWGAGVHFVVKPAERMVANLEYAQGIDDNRGVYLKFGYAW